jgi:alginate O-acetyltransferase complex protein AlgI
MLFNSIEFAIFLPLVFFIYWFVVNKNLRLQNFFLLVVSYIFYGWWDWRFLSLLIFSSVVDYLVGIGLDRQEDPLKRKMLISTSIVVNLGLLGFFKYFNFFVDSFVDAFTFLGHPIQGTSLNIILPVGISFYTFQTLSYSIDVYRRTIPASKDPIAFFTYVTFFPQLVAGPIERAENLLPQFYQKRKFDFKLAVDGIRQILWGLFAKIVIADNCAIYANDIFNNYEKYSGSTLLLGAIFFAFQIYGDFSGYSNIAIGTSRLFGFTLMRNFAFPYFSRDMAEFWRRWHISLTTWFRDYVYIPLGGSAGGTMMKIRNTFIIFLVSGFWHGANWTFIIWGLLNALYFVPLLLMGKNRRNLDIVAEGRLFPSVKETLQISSTFFLTLIAWVFFRSQSVHQAIEYLMSMFTSSLFTMPPVLTNEMIITILSVWLFVLIEWIQRDKQHALDLAGFSFPRPVRLAGYFSLIILIFVFGNFNKTEFIYFAF